MAKHLDLTGLRFGRLTVLGLKDYLRQPSGRPYYLWECLCDCGKITNVAGGHLRNGHTQSCGCYNKDVITTHGKTKTRLYSIWHKMKDRCLNENHTHYKYYGGRGISICDEWFDFSKFEEWAMQSGYNDSLTLDRINNDGNYSPENCKWSTVMEQNNNRNANRYLEYDGITYTMANLARKAGIPYGTFIKRLDAWKDVKKAVETPYKPIKGGV